MGLASINRSPLGMGILTGRFATETEFNDDGVGGSAQWFPVSKTVGPHSGKWMHSTRFATC